MSDTPKTVQQIIDGSSHCMVRDGTGDLHDAVKAKISDLRQIERQLAEAQRVPPEAFGDSRYAVGWNDCLAWVRQVRSDAAIAATGGKDALQSEDAWCNQIGEVKDA